MGYEARADSASALVLSIAIRPSIPRVRRIALNSERCVASSLIVPFRYTSAICQALAAKLSTAQQRLTQAQTGAAADRQAGQQQEQAAQSRLSERQAALQQVQSQASGVSVSLDQARQRTLLRCEPAPPL